MSITKTNKKKNGLQGYRVRVSWTDSKGNHRVERAAYGLEEAKRLEMALQSEHNSTTQGTRITFNELIPLYLEEKKYKVRETSLDREEKKIKLFITPFFGDMQVRKVTIKELTEWKMSIEKEDYSLNYKKDMYKHLRSIFRYAVNMDYIYINPMDRLENFKDAYEEQTNIDFYTTDEFKAFKKAMDDRLFNVKQQEQLRELTFYAFFITLFYSGARKGELLALTWNDYDGDSINITKSLTQKLKGEDRVTPPKNKSSNRKVKLPSPNKEVLNGLKKAYKSIPNFNDDMFIFGGQRCIRDTSISNYNIEVSKMAKIKHIRIHDFRHSHASALAHAGVNIQEIAHRLGHSNVNITWNTYSHLYPSAEDIAVNVLNKI